MIAALSLGGCSSTGGTPSFPNNRVAPPSSFTPTAVIPTSPVTIPDFAGIQHEPVAIDGFHLTVGSAAASTCNDRAQSGKGFVFVQVRVTGISPTNEPDIGAFAWRLLDAAGDDISALIGTACAGPAPAGWFTVAFEVPGTARSLALEWNPGDSTGHEAIVPILVGR